ncbi:hypothetical protein DAEQUDRAFT_115003 [Daedalea quercina L-15889]|uniref:Uncharacterized protein n=1 Tax=Daedalea quercina L-15889 TaxID=1314783 RepID=A0A165KUA5_9APHY|nr:hypothetical protein DAEQUDRAFT_115003 [Daedalea quercina L-15889]
MEPFYTLPRCLVPSRRYVRRPPRLFYAWPAPENVMMDYARKRRLVKRMRGEVDVIGTLIRVLHRMIRFDGVADIDRDFLQIKASPIGEDSSGVLLVSLYTNWDLKRRDLPSDEMIEKIRLCLGIDEKPRWYLDGYYWFWDQW